MGSAANSEVLVEFRQAVDSLTNPATEEWKRSGGKILGCLYTAIPDELIAAAGLLPYHISPVGSTGTEFSDGCLSQINCTFVRHTLDSALRGELNFLDGLVGFNQCDHLRRLFDNWVHKARPSFSHFVFLPKKSGKEQAGVFHVELLKLKKALEEQFKVEISKEKLVEAIRLYNETRRLQRELYALRKSDSPAITGADTLAAMVAAFLMPREHYNQKLGQLIADVRAAAGTKPAARLMLVGGELDDPRYLELLESQGGVIVADSLSFGSRALWEGVSEIGDPLENLANYYALQRPPCPKFFGTASKRLNYVKEIAKEYRVDGIIAVRLLMCDQWAFELNNLSIICKEAKIPYLQLETEYVLSNAGQTKTRVQAFMEMLGGGAHGNRE